MPMQITRSQLVSARSAPVSSPQHVVEQTRADKIIAKTRTRVDSLRGWFALLGIVVLVIGFALAFCANNPLALLSAVGICISLYVLFCTISGSMYARASFEILSDK